MKMADVRWRKEGRTDFDEPEQMGVGRAAPLPEVLVRERPFMNWHTRSRHWREDI